MISPVFIRITRFSYYFKRKNVISLIFSFAMLGIIGYFALSALQSGDKSSIRGYSG